MNPINRLLEKLDEVQLWEKEIALERNAFLKNGYGIDTNLYFVKNGCLRIFVIDGEEEHTIRLGYTNNLITCLDSYITEQASDLYIQALRKTELKVLSKKRFTDFIYSTAENRQIWDSILESFILQQMERERDILTASAQERYNRVAKRSPHLFQEVPHKYIAAYLRMTPETLSRLKKS